MNKYINEKNILQNIVCTLRIAIGEGVNPSSTDGVPDLRDQISLGFSFG